MRRALVLTNEAARHPFRQSLPAKALALPVSVNGVEAQNDARLFWLTFAVGFTSIYTFIA
jgi:hypothetical protein